MLNKVNFVPSYGKLLLRVDPDPEIKKSKGGIILPSQDLDPAIAEVKKCTVMATAEYKIENGIKIHIDYKIGDRVYINAMPGHNGMRIKVDDEVYNIIQEVNILGKFDDSVKNENI
jgi:co-chaperonin GroES (HSP10)